MKRDLTAGEIHQLLNQECYGHLACCTDIVEPYLIPITYVYRHGKVYSFSFEGKKIEIMRKNPYVCFQVEQCVHSEEWKSAQCWGTYQELIGEEREEGFALLIERFWDESKKRHPLYLPFRHSAKTLEAAKKEENVVLYCINVEKETGRMEIYE